MGYIKRLIDNELIKWKDSDRRKPLLLRGARQVGKSSTVRELGKKFDYFIEINFEKKVNQDIKTLFESALSVHQICDELSLKIDTPIIPGRTLLFLDEIQASIPTISLLRYFYEDFPELHVIAAGSLLEFALEELPSFGVGRIRSMFLYPFSFEEFLRAQNLNMLADALQKASPEKPLSDMIHKRLVQYLIRFIIIGGMPEVVATYVEKESLLECQHVLDDLMLSLYDDFSKYKSRVPTARLREVFSSVIEQTGGKFIYSKADANSNLQQIKESISLLELAGIIYPVTNTAATGIPLAATSNSKFRKYLIYDTGILQRFLRLDVSQILLGEDITQINKGALAELFVGLELLKAAPCTNPTQLYYWQRDKRGSEAEIDYIIQYNQTVVPVEVKAGTKGTMQSLFLFLSEKQYPYGIRTSLENFGVMPQVKIYPLYAIAQVGQGGSI
ncbi:ATPase [Bacteroidia bacterium]|nr:ATPase [Bacteroidia bacterium]